ncbi:MAG TPA: hypothetical protein VGM19_02985 [Armatimonadota bacterium]|jgi:prepilin-type processing-associated H-X9-DG protein
MSENPPANPTPAWISRQGQVHGPYTLVTVEQLFRQGRLGPDDLVSVGEGSPWQAPSKLFAAGPPPPPPPPATAVAAVAPTSRSNPLLWVLPLVAVGLIIVGGIVAGVLAKQGANAVHDANQAERCSEQLKVLALSVRMYAADYAALPADWEAALETRQVPRETWVCPVRADHLPYLHAPAPDLGKVKSGDPQTPLFWEPPLASGRGPHQGQYEVGYADGHVALRPEPPGEKVTPPPGKVANGPTP